MSIFGVKKTRLSAYKLFNKLAELTTKEAELTTKEAELDKRQVELDEREAELSIKEENLVLETIGIKWRNLNFLKDYCWNVHRKRVRTFHEAWKYIFPRIYVWIEEEKKRLVNKPKKHLKIIQDTKKMCRSTSYEILYNFKFVVDRASIRGCGVDVYYDLFDIKEIIKENKKQRKLKKEAALLVLHKGEIFEKMDGNLIKIIASYLGLNMCNLNDRN